MWTLPSGARRMKRPPTFASTSMLCPKKYWRVN